MKAEILLFGPVADALDGASLRLEVEGSTLGDLSQALQDQHPQLKSLIASCRWARNQHFVDLNETFDESDELALIPPVAGG